MCLYCIVWYDLIRKYPLTALIISTFVKEPFVPTYYLLRTSVAYL